MNSSNQHDHQTLMAAKEEVDTILKKYDLCGFLVLASQTGGIQGFSFRDWSGMDWGVNEDGQPFTHVTISVNPSDLSTCYQKVTNCYTITNYFSNTLSSQCDNIQQVNDDICTAFNLDREAIETDCDCKNLH